jgi:hypothetical protein
MKDVSLNIHMKLFRTRAGVDIMDEIRDILRNSAYHNDPDPDRHCWKLPDYYHTAAAWIYFLPINRVQDLTHQQVFYPK